MDLEMELTPNHLRWEIYGTGDRDGVDLQKVQHKYGDGDGVDTPAKNWPQFGSHMVIITLDGSTCKTCIISTSAIYIWHTCEKVKKKQSSQQKMEMTNNSE